MDSLPDTVLTFLGIPALNVFCQALGFNMGGTVISSGFSGGVYGLYLIAGYFLKKGVFRIITSKVLWFTLGISFGGAVISQLYSYFKGIGYNIWYSNLFLLLLGICIFELTSRIKKVPFTRFFTTLSYYSFAIYLVHNPINMVLKRQLASIEPRPLRVLIVWGVTIVISILVSFAISKIPKFGKKILYMK